MAKIAIVDKNENIIGYKERKDELDTDIHLVSSLWVENSKGDVLLAQRKLNKRRDPGLWGPAVAGTVEEGETFESNMLKEAEEEIGLTDFKFRLGPKLFMVTNHQYFVQYFFATVDGEIERFRVQEDEVEKIRWIPRAEFIADIAKNPEKYVPSVTRYSELILNFI